MPLAKVTLNGGFCLYFFMSNIVFYTSILSTCFSNLLLSYCTVLHAMTSVGSELAFPVLYRALLSPCAS
jgi:hypothetical protein